MRRFLAVIGLILAVSGFVMIPVSIWKNIHFLIPIGLIAASFLILLLVKRMDAPDDENSGSADVDRK